MKTSTDLDLLLNELYWHCEHGEHVKAMEKLRKLQWDGWRDGLRDAARIVSDNTTKGYDCHESDILAVAGQDPR